MDDIRDHLMWKDLEGRLYESAFNLLLMSKKLDLWPNLAEKYFYNEKGEEIPEIITNMIYLSNYKAIAMNDALEKSSGQRQWFDI